MGWGGVCFSQPLLLGKQWGAAQGFLQLLKPERLFCHSLRAMLWKSEAITRYTTTNSVHVLGTAILNEASSSYTQGGES